MPDPSQPVPPSAEFIGHVTRVLHAFILSMVRNAADADDVLQALPKLQKLTLGKVGVSDADMAKLKADLPKVDIKFTPADADAVAKWRLQFQKLKPGAALPPPTTIPATAQIAPPRPAPAASAPVALPENVTASFARSNMMASSADGTKWELGTRDGKYKDYFRGLVFGNGTFMALGGDPTTVGAAKPFVALSRGGVQWDENLGIDGKDMLRRVTFGKGIWVGGGDRGRIASSPDFRDVRQRSLRRHELARAAAQFARWRGLEGRSQMRATGRSRGLRCVVCLSESTAEKLPS